MQTLTLLDFCCGRSGWSLAFARHGWHTTGLDIMDHSDTAPGRFIQADGLTWQPDQSYSAIVASPPCEAYSRHGMPWTRAKQPPEPDLRLWHQAEWLAVQLRCPIVLENVRTAQLWHGRSVSNYGPFHLWRDAPIICPTGWPRRKSHFTGNDPARRAVIPPILAAWVAQCLTRQLR